MPPLRHDAAAELRAAFNTQMKAYQHDHRLARYRTEIAQLEHRRNLAISRGENTYARRLERMIAHRRQHPAEGWPDEV